MNVVTISVDSTAIVLKTNCNQAARHFERKPLFFEGSTYDTKAGYGAEEAPVLRYVDDRIYHMDFDREQRTLTVSAPWSGRGSSQLLRRSLWLLAEYVRQERGECTFHASAISNGDLGTVFLAPSEAGKTTLVLELCLHHGFQLIANDQVRLGLRDGRPTILGGDRSMNLRLASLSQYSSQLAQRVFGDIQNYPFPWLEKKRVAPAELGLRTDNSDERTLDKVIFA